MGISRLDIYVKMFICNPVISAQKNTIFKEIFYNFGPCCIHKIYPQKHTLLKQFFCSNPPCLASHTRRAMGVPPPGPGHHHNHRNKTYTKVQDTCRLAYRRRRRQVFLHGLQQANSKPKQCILFQARASSL